jgi:glycosyltransferase involved in cell wall biosynthesis
LEGVSRPTFALSNGVDTNRFSQPVPDNLRKQLDLPNKPIVLCLGRLDRDKSIHVLLEAIPKILKQTPVHFVIAGWGDLYDSLIETLKKTGLDKHVTATGQISYETDILVALYGLADIFVIPSTIETQSIVTMEAMAAGKPVVAANAGALPELVADSDNGYLFKPGDSQDLATKVVHLLKDEALRTKMGQRSRERVKKHDLQANLSRFENLYQKVVSHEI